MRKIFAVVVCVLAFQVTQPAHAQESNLITPIPGPVVRRFDAPNPDWQPGHRGIDLLGYPGETIIATAAGTITYAGNLAGRGVLVISHGELRTTYEPVSPTVKVGDYVTAGQEVGKLNSGHSCSGTTCLHLGLKRGDEYLDPSSYLNHGTVRLLPAEAAEIANRNAAARENALVNGKGIPGLLSMPTAGAIGSGFGMRLHPIFNEWRMHEGVDIGAPCLTPIRAAAAGTVEQVSYDESGGNRLIINHGMIGGRTLRTHYLHATSYQVQVGEHVERGEVVGKVGSTGWSTGCHLHFAVSVDRRQVDPAGFL
ncbi:MAG: peptidoglycan DD-metalloendopeptidase family protein [Propionibacteriaceae bacterium]|nr:peptidoglycan DD-metalloendopeptidase family protein [Propionibacteriaceae bacterium]